MRMRAQWRIKVFFAGSFKQDEACGPIVAVISKWFEDLKFTDLKREQWSKSLVNLWFRAMHSYEKKHGAKIFPQAEGQTGPAAKAKPKP